MSDTEDEYIGAAAAAEILSVSQRQALRYAVGPDAAIRSQRVGRRVLLNHADVQALAEQRAFPREPDTPDRPAGRMVHSSTVTARYEEITDKLTNAAHSIGTLEERVRQLQAQLDSRPLLEDHTAIQAERDALRAQRDELQRQLAAAQRPWWKKFLG